MRKRSLIVAAMVAAGVTLAPALAATAQDEPRKTITDAEFVSKAAVAGSTEVVTAKMALERGSGAEVKKFAQKMLDEHTKANQELLRLAGAKRMAVPRTLDAKHQAVVDKLSKLHGEAFDREYIKAQVQAHKDAVELFTAASEQVLDPAIKAFAAKTLPTLKEHHKMIQELEGGEATDREEDKPSDRDKP